ncbi:UNVERIFIED_CONTAM: Cellulose synthase-like protein G2 [Sesamum latifolium]|uniref:Cellulose synthase-like protein G2 n=1 Tax=Sesamum latifolium TaxID=2727402 RepID=A0AAW2XTV7_9LAMI
MEKTRLPLHHCHVMKTDLIINRLYMFILGTALLALFYYRITTLSHIIKTRESPLVPHLLVFISELLFTFLWVLHQAYRWRPVTRTVYPNRLPGDDKFPPVDVFICTADPSKEPPLGVMNTVISAMALDYPPDKLAVYLSDDGGSYVTLHAVREAWKFSKWWLPFCRKYELKTRCPGAYFSAEESRDDRFISCSEFLAEEKEIEKKYNEFKESLEKNSVNASSSVSRDHAPIIERRYNEFKENLGKNSVNASSSVSRDHAPIIEVMNEAVDSSQQEMPILVYVAREKRPSRPHHFKAGALNALIRVSAVISNAPYILLLDCDHYCNDPTSARQAMCYYLDPKISPKLAFVQFPQKFHNISEHDLYEGRLHYYWVLYPDYFERRWLGAAGVGGQIISGCNCYLKREALYGTKNIRNDIDLNQLKKSFGSSNELIQLISMNHKPHVPKDRKLTDAQAKEVELLASCDYEDQSEWGKQASWVPIFFCGGRLHDKRRFTLSGVDFCVVDPPRPCFLGLCPTNLSDTLVQQGRWGVGLMQISLSKYCALLYGRGRLSTLHTMCYAAISFDPIYVVPFYVLAIVPQICLIGGIPLYPKVSDPYFIVFAFVFLASQLKHVQEVVSYGDSLMSSLYELRMWMMKSASSYLYASLGAVLDKIGLHTADFTLTNKAGDDDEQAKLYQEGRYDFQASPALVAPICSLYILNVVSFVVGMARIVETKSGSEMLVQAFIPLFGVIVNYQVFEGMVLRKDRGRIAPSVSVLSAAIATFVLCFGSLVFIY